MQSLWLEAIFLLTLFWLLALTVILIRISKKTVEPKAIQAGGDLLNSTDLAKYFQYFSLVKYNPFSDTGGEQSFIFTLLNGQKTGVIITSLHGRGITRFYAKKIITGQSDQELSAEEKLALSQALHSKL